MDLSWAEGIDPDELERLAAAVRRARKQDGQTRKYVPRLAACAKLMLGTRALRVTQFGPIAAVLFGEAAYDMLLDLYVQHVTASPPSVSSVCMATSAPATTALRHLRVLEEYGLIVRIPDPDDGRRTYIHLTDEALLRLEEHLESASERIELFVLKGAG